MQEPPSPLPRVVLLYFPRCHTALARAVPRAPILLLPFRHSCFIKGLRPVAFEARLKRRAYIYSSVLIHQFFFIRINSSKKKTTGSPPILDSQFDTIYDERVCQVAALPRYL